jgi:hypothetical protein
MFFHYLPESLKDFLGIGPNLGVFFFIFAGAAEPQPHNRQGAGNGSADFSISPQAPAERSQGLDDFIVLPPQLFLPDRKNGLTSMEPLHHHLHGLFAHLFLGHFPLHLWFVVLLYCFPSPNRVGPRAACPLPPPNFSRNALCAMPYALFV